MTKKDYELIASAISECHELAQMPEPKRSKPEVVRQVALMLAESLSIDNPRFDRDRFLAACGLEAQL